MTIHFTRDLESLQSAISQLSGMAISVVRQSVATLENPDPERSRQLAANDDIIDLTEIRIKENCLKILALHQPVAKDLRRIASVMKISGELERVADVGINIAERGAALVNLPAFPIPEHLLDMAYKAALQLERSLAAYEQMDRLEAALVCGGDEEIDDLHRLVIEELTTAMKQSRECVAPAMHLFSAARNIERIGDHATNIAEDVIYLVDGRIIRHATSISRFQRESA